MTLCSTLPIDQGFGVLKVISAFAFSTCLLASHAAWADDACTITALRDVAAVDSPTTAMRTGDQESSITGYQVDRGTRIASFCQHGGYC